MPYLFFLPLTLCDLLISFFQTQKISGIRLVENDVALMLRVILFSVFSLSSSSRNCIPLICWTAAAVRVDAAFFPAFPVQTVLAVIYVVVPRLALRSHDCSSFRPRQGKKRVCQPNASLWVTGELCSINHIRKCRIRTKTAKAKQMNLYSKAPESIDFPGLLTCFDVACTAIYLLLNCGARLAALRPYFLRSFILGSRVR